MIIKIILLIILVITGIAMLVGVIAFIKDLFKKTVYKPYGPYERFVKRPQAAPGSVPYQVQ